LTNAAGALALAQPFDPYGGLLSSQGSAATPYGFTGEWGDASGLLYLRARYYLPQAGIFTSRDPFPGFTTLPVTLQPYLYAAGNPLRYTDPSGKIIPLLAIAGIGFAAGAIYNAFQQTNGFTNFCHFDVLELLAWGAGGTAAAITATFLAVSGVGLAGMGLQGVALGLFELGLASPLSTTLWIGGSTAFGWATTASGWLWSGGAPNPLYTNPGNVANLRAKSLQEALPQGSQGRVTMAAGVVEDSFGERQVLIGTSEPNGYIRPTVRPLINPNETIATGIGHAEENIVNWAQVNNRRVISVGAGRPICFECARLIKDAGGIIASPLKPR
jgi:RHS repeat-associated protein